MAQTFTSNYGQLAKDKGADITKVDGFNQAMDLLLSNRVDGTFNKDVDDKVVSDFNDGLKTLKENGKLAEIGKKWFGENVSEPK